MKIKFVHYSGKYPCLCNGVLTLEIDDEVIKFGSGQDNICFWRSGGRCGFNYDWTEEYVRREPWVLIEENLPDKYKNIGLELINVFNEHVPYGCCGGCL